jgi:hypothetical protein
MCSIVFKIAVTYVKRYLHVIDHPLPTDDGHERVTTHTHWGHFTPLRRVLQKVTMMPDASVNVQKVWGV